MSITRFLNGDGVFDPNDIKAMSMALDDVCKTLNLVDGNPAREVIAERIIALELMELQRQNPPFGGLATAPISALRRVFVSPGPIYEPEGRRPDYWRFARALFAAGFRAGDLVHNTFSYHLTPAGAMVESGAEAITEPVAGLTTS